MKALPNEFVQRMKSLLAQDYAAFENAVNQEPVKAFRVNTDKITLSDFEKINVFSSEKIPFVENGFYLDFEKVGNHPYHHAGMIYVQEPAAMMPAECIDINPEWKILDMCAAPGGKSTQLKNKLGKKGVLVSNEFVPSRCKILTGNIERLGLCNTVTTCMDTSKLAKLYPKTFDLVMVDAPCSGEGMFRKDDVAITEWSLQNVAKCAERQTEILENAALAVRDGGYIIYATCTFSLEENEKMIDLFLQRHSEYELVQVNSKVIEHTVDGILFDGCHSKTINYTRRFYPHISKGEGQFVAVLHNTNGENYEAVKIKSQSQKVDRAVFDFLDSVLDYYEPQNVKIYNGNPVYFTPEFDVKDGTAFSCGITIGELRKNYIQPHHQFFMGLGKYFKRKIELKADSDDIQKYLRGEEFAIDCDNGWAVVTVEGCALGGIKVVNGRAKNHYPKGLRKM